MAANLVKGGATFLSVRKEVELAVRGGGARVTRPVGQRNPLMMGSFSCGNRGHVQRFYPRGRAVAMRNGRPEWCWGCGGVCEWVPRPCGRCPSGYALMMWTLDWEYDSGEHGVGGGEPDGGIRVMYMNVGRRTDATHEFLKGCARGDVAVAFVGEWWVEKQSGVGTQLHPDYVRLVSERGGGKVACYVRRDLVDFRMLVGCENTFVCVEIGGVRIRGVYCKCGAKVHDILSWLGRIQDLVGNGHWILLGDWNAHHAEWSLPERSDSVGRVLEEWRTNRGARLLKGRSHTYERHRGDEVVVSRIDFALAGGGVESGTLSSEWGLSDRSAIGCFMAVDAL